MIGENLHLFHRFQGLDEVSHSAEIIRIIGQPGHQHVADPHGFAHVAKAACQGENVVVPHAGDTLVQILVHGLQVQHNQIGVFHQPFKVWLIVRILPVRLPGGIQGGMHPFLVRQGKQFGDKGQL